MQISKSFTSVSNGTDYLLLRPGDSLDYVVSGTFNATYILQRSNDGGQTWKDVVTGTTGASGRIKNDNGDRSADLYRFVCSVFASGTMVTTISDANTSAIKRIISAPAHAKVGGTAGFVVAAAANIALVTCPASQTGSKLVVPMPDLKVGDRITGFHLVGQIESAGNAVTLDAELRKHTAAAADVADASVGSITQLSVTADAIMGATNTRKAALDVVVAEDETYYVLITATTLASTDIALQAVAIEVIPA